MLEERWPNKVLHWNPPERIKRGKPTETWTEGVEETMKSRNFQIDDYRERENWRRKIVARDTVTAVNPG